MNVLIFGLGLHGGGASAARYYAQKGDTVCVTDMNSASQLQSQIDTLSDLSISYTLGGHTGEDIEWADMIIKSPAVSPAHPLLAHQDNLITTDIIELLSYCSSRPEITLIGVSGTKGKSSSVNTLKQIHTDMGEKVFISGNIGISGFETLTQLQRTSGPCILILELSSFQIRDLFCYGTPEEYHFTSLFLTSIYADHQDYYETFQEYVEEKLLLYTLHHSHLYISEQASSFLSSYDYPIHTDASVYSSLYQLYGRKEPEQKEMLPHRNSLVGMSGYLSWYDDSAATIPEATLFTLSRHDRPFILICGGSDKHCDYAILRESFLEAVSVILLSGEATSRGMIPILQHEGVRYHGPFGSMNEAVMCARRIAPCIDPIDVILSPAAASFSLFANSDERGDIFIESVNALLHGKA